MKVIRKAIRGYYGMNHEAGKELRVKKTPPRGTIYVDPKLKGRMLKRTIAHEKIESYLMRHKHLRYGKAHKIAMKFEKNVR